MRSRYHYSEKVILLISSIRTFVIIHTKTLREDIFKLNQGKHFYVVKKCSFTQHEYFHVNGKVLHIFFLTCGCFAIFNINLVSELDISVTVPSIIKWIKFIQNNVNLL